MAKADEDEVLLANFERELSQLFKTVKEKHFSSAVEPQSHAHFGSLGFKLFQTSHRIRHTPELADLKKAQLLFQFGEKLAAIDEHEAAQKYFFAQVLALDDASRSTSPAAVQLRVRVLFATALCAFQVAKQRDHLVRFPGTLAQMVGALRTLQQAMELALDHEKRNPHQFAWLVFNGTVLVFTLARPLLTMGFASDVINFFKWTVLSMNAVLSLNTSKYILWRVRLHLCICEGYHGLAQSDPTNAASYRQSALACAEQAEYIVKNLRKEEELDAPLPSSVEKTLNQAHLSASVALILAKIRMTNESLARKSIEAACTNPTDQVLVVLQMLEQSFRGNRRVFPQTESERETDHLLDFLFELLSPWVANTSSPSAPRQPMLPIDLHLTMIKCFMRANRHQELRVLVAAARRRMEEVEVEAQPMIESELRVFDAFCELRAESTDPSPADKFRSQDTIKLTGSSKSFSKSRLLGISSDLRGCALFHKPSVSSTCRDVLCAAATVLWNEYGADLVNEVERMPDDALRMDTVALTSELLLSVHHVFQVIELDDVVLCTTVALKLGVLLRERNKRRLAIQVLRSALDTVDSTRDRVSLEVMHNGKTDRVSLGCASFTALLDSELSRSDCYSGNNSRDSVGVNGAGAQYGSLHQDLCCLQTDLYCLLFQIELDDARAADLHRKMTSSTGEKPLAQQASLQAAWDRVLSLECRRNGYLRVLLTIEQIRLLPVENVTERESKAEYCLSLLRRLENQERELKGRLTCKPVAEESDLVPRAPVITSRCSSSVSLLILPYRPARSVLRKRRICNYIVYAKEAGTGTEVSLNNTDFPGTAEPVFVDDKAPNASGGITMTVSGLVANEAYMFAVAAFDENGEIIEGIGSSTPPVVALNPLPLPQLYGYLARILFSTLSRGLAKKAAISLYNLYSSQQGSGRPLWQANPLYGQSLRVDVAARLPTAALNTIVETLSILCCDEVGDADVDGMISNKLRVVKPMQLQALELIKKMNMAIEIALSTRNDEALIQAAFRAYLHALPLLHLSSTKGLVFQPLLSIFESLMSIPGGGTIDDVKRLLAHVGYEIFRIGRDHPELISAARKSISTLPRDVSSPSLTKKSDLQVLRECIALDNLYRGKDEWQVDEEPTSDRALTDRPTSTTVRDSSGVDTSRKAPFNLKDAICQGQWNLEGVFNLISLHLKDDIRFIEYVCRISAVAIRRREFGLIESWLSSLKISAPISTSLQEVLRNLGAGALIAEQAAVPATPSSMEAASAHPNAANEASVYPSEQKDSNQAVSKDSPMSSRELASRDAFLALWCGEYFLIRVLLELHQILSDSKRSLNGFDGPQSEVSFDLLNPDVFSIASAPAPAAIDPLQEFPSLFTENCVQQADESRDHFVAMLSYAAVSCHLFVQAKAWQALQANCQFIWNGMWAAWISPRFFRRNPDSLEKLSVCVNCCLEMIDVVVSAEKDKAKKQQETANGTSDWQTATGNSTMSGSLVSTTLISITQASLRSRDDLWLSNFMLLALEVYGACEEWDKLVTTGLRFHALSGGASGSPMSENVNDIPSTRSFSEKAIALIAYAQQQLVMTQSTKVNSAQAQLAAFVADFEAAEAKKKKKKKSKLVVEQTLTPEEIEFQEAKSLKENDLQMLQECLDQLNTKLASILSVQDALSKAKHKCIYALEVSQQLRTSFLRKRSMSQDAITDETQPTMNQVVHAYKQCIAIGRQKRMTSLTTEALHELGDFFLACGDAKNAQRSWNESVDNAFGTLNVTATWRALLKEPLDVMLSGQRQDAIARISNQGFLTSLQSCVVLTKLALQTSGSNLFQMVEYARMAATIYEMLFVCSLPHPVLAFLHGSYVMNEDFWPGRNMFSDAKRLPVFGVGLLLMFIPEILVRYNFNVDAMPLVTAYEHTATFTFHSVSHTVNAKRLRLEALVNEYRLDEAVVVINQLLQGIELPVSTQPIVLRAGTSVTELADGAFHVNKHLHHSLNGALLAWISKLDLLAIATRLVSLYGSTLAVLVCTAVLKFIVCVACNEQLNDAVSLRQAALKSAISFYQSIRVGKVAAEESKDSVSSAAVNEAPGSPRNAAPPTSSRNQPSSNPVSARDTSGASSASDGGVQVPSLDKSAGEVVRIPSEVLLLQGKLAYAMGQWSQARSWSLQAIRELPAMDPVARSDGSIEFELLKQSVLTTLQCRLQIIKCDLAQSRLTRVLEQVEHGVEEAQAHGEKLLELELRVHRIIALVRLGEKTTAESDASSLRDDFRRCCYEHSIPYVTLLQILCDLSCSSGSGHDFSGRFAKARDFVVEATAIVDVMLTQSGWIGVKTDEHEHRVNLYWPLVVMFIRLKVQLAQLLLQIPLESDESPESRRQQALRVVEDGIRALDHTINPLPTARAQLLLLKGAALHRSSSTDLQQLEQAVCALRASIQTSMERGGHDRDLIHSALMELVELFQNSLAANDHKEKDIQAAFYYLTLALQNREHAVQLLHSLQLQEAPLSSSDKLPAFIASEVVARVAEPPVSSAPAVVVPPPMSPRGAAAAGVVKTGTTDDSPRLANYFLRLLREREVLPSVSEPNEQLVIAFHSFLIENCPSYGKSCCFAQLPAIPSEDQEIKGGFVCACFAPSLAPALSSEPNGAGRDHVRLFFTCGPALLDASNASDRFASAPVLNKSRSIDIARVRLLKSRCSMLRIDMEDEGSLLINPAEFQRTFVAIAQDIQSLLDPLPRGVDRNESGLELLDSAGKRIPFECTKENVGLLENLLDLERGVQTVEKALCYFLRDALEK